MVNLGLDNKDFTQRVFKDKCLDLEIIMYSNRTPRLKVKLQLIFHSLKGSNRKYQVYHLEIIN